MSKATTGGRSGGGKQTTPPVSTLASGVLSGRIKPTASQVRTLAATALSQDQTKGQTRG